MCQFYFMEKFFVLRIIRLLVSSRYRRMRKMQLHVVLFALFIYTIFKEDNTPVICIHGPTYGDSRGIAGVRCWTITFWLSPQCRGSVGVITLEHLPCWDFLLWRVGQRAGLLPSACPHKAGLIPGLWKVKIIIPPIPVGGGAVDTNDWCINYTYRSCCIYDYLAKRGGRT